MLFRKITNNKTPRIPNCYNKNLKTFVYTTVRTQKVLLFK